MIDYYMITRLQVGPLSTSNSYHSFHPRKLMAASAITHNTYGLELISNRYGIDWTSSQLTFAS